MEFTKERLAHLAAQHRMDWGGHEWTPGPLEGTVSWDDPDWDYLTGDRPDGVQPGTSYLFVWKPTCSMSASEWEPLPESIPLPDRPGMILDRVSHGRFNERDTECDCAEIEGPHFKCPMCEGTGYIDCDGGPWAVYRETLDSDAYALRVGADGMRIAARADFSELVIGLGPDAWDAAEAALDRAVGDSLLCSDAADAILDSMQTDPPEPDPDVAVICALWLGRR